MPTVVIHIANGRVTEVDSDAAELRVITIDHDAPTRNASAQLYQPDQFCAFAVEAKELTYLLSSYLARAAEHALTTPWPEREPPSTRSPPPGRSACPTKAPAPPRSTVSPTQ